MPIKEWARKHFKFTKDITMGENLAYTNIRCQAVSNEIRKTLGKVGEYNVGETLICRLYKKDEEGKLNVNIRWKVIKVEGMNITIQDIKDKDNVRTFDTNTIEKHFRYAYCATVHSRQGASIDGNIIIHESNRTELMSREWIYTSITRARDFNKVFFYENKEGEDEMFRNLLLNYFKKKVEGYKLQDKRAGRVIDEEQYIDEHWCVKRFHGCCGHCGVKFNLDTKAGKMSSNFTAQRCDNEVSHHVNNCDAWCDYCNKSAH